MSPELRKEGGDPIYDSASLRGVPPLLVDEEVAMSRLAHEAAGLW